MDRRTDRRAAGWLALVLALHVAVFLLLQSQPLHLRQAPAADRPPLLVRLLWPEPARPQPPAAEAPSKRPPSAAPAMAAPTRPVAAEPGRIQAPAPDPGLTSDETSPPHAGSAPAGNGPLVLSLPPQAASAPRPLRESALNDPRSNTRQTYSERFAATLGTDLTVRITPIEGGRIVRKGSSCVIVMDSRASTIDPDGPKWPGAAKSCD